MQYPHDGRTLSPTARYLLVVALVVAFATAVGAASMALVVTAQTPLAQQAASPATSESAPAAAVSTVSPLACVPPGSADAATIYTLYGAHGVAPAVAPECASGLAVDLDLLRAAMGLP